MVFGFIIRYVLFLFQADTSSLLYLAWVAQSSGQRWLKKQVEILTGMKVLLCKYWMVERWECLHLSQYWMGVGWRRRHFSLMFQTLPK